MHNLFANIVIILEGCKCFVKDLVNDKGNVPRLVFFQGAANFFLEKTENSKNNLYLCKQ